MNKNNPFYYDLNQSELLINATTKKHQSLLTKYMKLNTDNTDYISMAERKYNLEQQKLIGNLEKDLEEHNSLMDIDKDINDFNFKDIRESSEFTVDRILNNIEETSITIEDSLILTDKYNSIKQQVFIITRHFDMIDKICLVIDLPEHFINLPFDLKLKILDINFTLEIGGQQISNLNTFTGLFMDYCNKINPVTITNNNQLIIPMINFISMHGLPIVALQWHEIRVKINKDNILDDYKFSIKVDGRYLLDSRRQIVHNNINGTKNPIFILDRHIIESKNLHNRNEFHLSLISKCLIFYFEPIQSIDSENILLEPPEIETVKVTINGLEEGLFYDQQNILSFEIFGISMFIVSFSPEFDSWDNDKTKLTNIGIEMQYIDAVFIELTYNGNIDSYNLIVNSLGFNILNIMSGMAGLLAAS